MRLALRIVLAVLPFAMAGSVLAQAPAQSPVTGFPGQPSRNVPPPGPPPTPQFEFSIPAPQRGPIPRAVDEIQFQVSDIKIVGATVFPQSAFRPLTAPIIGHQARLSDIIGVADKIEAMYRARGFVLVRAFVPPQTVANGVFQINVVEGFVQAAAVSGGDAASRARVNAYVQPVTQERPATLGSLERGLLLANDLPGVSASGLLRPSPTQPGASDLLVDLNQSPYQATLYSDNRGAASTGAVTLGGQVVANDLYVIPGQILFDASGTPDFSQRRVFQARYADAVGTEGAILGLSGVSAHGVPAAASGALISDSWSLSTTLSYPIIVSRERQLTLQGALNVQSERVNILNECIENDDQWRTASIAASVQQRDLLPGAQTGVTLGVTQGIPILGARSTEPCTESEGASLGFTKYTFVGDHDQPIAGALSANFNALGQWSSERLVTGEQTSFGGSGIGRGYDPASLAADIGVGVASELRYDTHFPSYYVQTAQFYVFFDAAEVRGNHDLNVLVITGGPNHRSLLSTGVGVRVSLPRAVSGGIEFAQELRGVPNNDQGKTGARILFNAAVSF